MRRCGNAPLGLIISKSERAFHSLGFLPGAPPRNERTRKSGVLEIDRKRIVDDAAQSRWRDRQPYAPQFSSSHSFIWLRRSPSPPAGIATLIRTGNRRSASVIINLELAAMGSLALCGSGKRSGVPWSLCPARADRGP